MKTTYLTKINQVNFYYFIFINENINFFIFNSINKEINIFINKYKTLKVSEETVSTIEKEGFDTGLLAVNPISGKDIPIWVANYVLADYGTGCVMSVPAHDDRDYEFASKYNLPIKPVIEGYNKKDNTAYIGSGILINSEKYNGLDSESAKNNRLYW